MMYHTALSLLIILGSAIASPVHIENTSQAPHQTKRVPIRVVKNYLKTAKSEAKGLVNEFQGVIENSPSRADIDHHRNVSQSYLPKALATIVAMRKGAQSMLQEIDENGLEVPELQGPKQDCHQLKKTIDAIKEVAVESLCSNLKRQEIIAYFKSDLNCLLGSIFELWRATERDGAYLHIGYRDVIQRIKDLLLAIEAGTRRFAEEINYMDFSKECQTYRNPEKAQVLADTNAQSKNVGKEGKEESKEEAKDEGKGGNGNHAVVNVGHHISEFSLVDQVEEVIKLEKNELDDLKEVAKKQIEKAIGPVVTANLSLPEEDAKEEEKQEKQEKEVKSELKEEAIGKDEAKKEEVKVVEKEDHLNETIGGTGEENKETEPEQKEKEEDEVKGEKDKEDSDEQNGGGEHEKKEGEDKGEQKEEKEENKVPLKEEEEHTEETKQSGEKVDNKESEKPKETVDLVPLPHDTGTVVNNETKVGDNIDEKLKVVFTNERKNLELLLNKLNESKETTNNETEKVETEKKEIKDMIKELDKVVAGLQAVDNITTEKENSGHKYNKVSIIDIITPHPVVTEELKVEEGYNLPTHSPSDVAKNSILLSTEKSEMSKEAITNLKDIENEEQSLENLKSFGNDVFEAPKDTNSTSVDEILRSDKLGVVPAKNESVEVNDIDAQEEKDEEERAKVMVEEEKKKEEQEKAEAEKKEENGEKEKVDADVDKKDAEKEEAKKTKVEKGQTENVDEEKEEKKPKVEIAEEKTEEKAGEAEHGSEEKNGEKAEENKETKVEEEEKTKKDKNEEHKVETPAEKATNPLLPVPDKSKNDTIDEILSNINDEEHQVKKLIEQLKA